jgi:hypothetical protein
MISGVASFILYGVVVIYFPDNKGSQGVGVIWFLLVACIMLTSLLTSYLNRISSSEKRDEALFGKENMDVITLVGGIFEWWYANYEGDASDKGILYKLVDNLGTEYRLVYTKLKDVSAMFKSDNMYFDVCEYANKLSLLNIKTKELLMRFDFKEYARRCSSKDGFTSTYRSMIHAMEENLKKATRSYIEINDSLGILIMSKNGISIYANNN